MGNVPNPKTYQVVIARRVERELRRPPEHIHDRVIRAMGGLAADPRPPGCRKLAGRQDIWRIRIGDYRVLYEVRETDPRVQVLRVAHRRDVYR